jgi:hypothetical protein
MNTLVSYVKAGMHKENLESIYNVETRKEDKLKLGMDSTAMAFGAYLKPEYGGMKLNP